MTRAPTQHQRASEAIEAEVFRLFPYGIVVLEADGTVIAFNQTAVELLGGCTEGATCCDLVGCRTPGGPLADACITELLHEHAGLLPEVRIDLRRGRSDHALWISVAQLSPTSRRLVMHVRPGDVHDRRRRTVPHWVAPPELRIATFGATGVQSREGSIGGRWLEGRPGQILKYLVCERHRVVHTDEIAEAIWPDSGSGGGGSVRYFVHALRGKVEPARAKRAPATFVVSRKGGYMLNARTVRIDADEFEEQVGAGMSALGRGGYDEAQKYLDGALELYTGDFLADEPYASWALAERDRLRELASEALRSLARIKLRLGAKAEALALIERVADLQPYDSDVQRNLIAMLIANGRRSDAVRRYDGLRRRFTHDFGEEPDFRLPDVSPAEARLD